MKSLLVSSIEEYSGKSALIVALGLILREKGFKVGYFKPFCVGTTRINDELVDEDAYNTVSVLNTGDDIEDICPVKLDRPYVEFVCSADPVSLKKRVMDSYKRISEDKDIVLVEGAVEYKVGRAMGLSDPDVSSSLDLGALMVVKYTSDFVLDGILTARELFGERLKFVLFNQLAGYKKAYVRDIAERFLKRNGMEMLGTLPYDPLLAGLFVSELGEALNGEWLVKPDEDVIIEEFLIGAMSPPAALKYFRRVRQATLITGGDRADLQNLALETGNIKCLLLTGHLEPPATMLGKAEDKGIPVILVADDTLTTVEKVDEVFGKVRIKGDAKIRRIKELVERFIDLKSLGVLK
ncbi:MAG: phosphotransacetylase family protein [Methanophagales archaeon]|nr:phosphotransacetylase family protein [Methanophagales archaeon]MCW3140897.1 phosphotransacetylase family protein [Methanophagales archaeon]